MSYSKHTWINGETITQELLNNIESGIANNDTVIQTLNNSKGRANGIAVLDSSGKIPLSQLPDDISTGGSTGTVTGNYIPISEKGIAGGVATLDSTGKITTSQLPDLNSSSSSGSTTSETPVRGTLTVQEKITAYEGNKIVTQGKFALLTLNMTFQTTLLGGTAQEIASFDSTLAPAVNVCQDTITNNGLSCYITATKNGSITITPRTPTSYNDGVRATIPFFIGY